MKRVSEINEELNQIKEKKEKLEFERERHISMIGSELKKKYPIVYGAYKDRNKQKFPFEQSFMLLLPKNFQMNKCSIILNWTNFINFHSHISSII